MDYRKVACKLSDNKRMSCGRSQQCVMRNSSLLLKGGNGECILRFRFRKMINEETKEVVKEQIREQTWGIRSGKKNKINKMPECQSPGTQKIRLAQDYWKIRGFWHQRGSHRTGTKCPASMRVKPPT